MRSRKVLLVLVPTTAAVAALAASALASLPPGSSYPWAQPDAALPVATCTQPPASVPITPAPMVNPAVGCSYAWAQPNAAIPVQAGTQPPAWVPIAPAESSP